MFVTNLRTKTMSINYKIGTDVVSRLVRGNTQIEIEDLTEVTQIVFNSYDKRLRDLKVKFPNRDIDFLLELRATANGALI